MIHSQSSSVEYRANYLQRLCQQNQTLFHSPYIWNFYPDDLPLDARKRFPNCQRTFLEIGFGHGEVVEELALHRTDTGFVGIERRPARVRRALKRLERIKKEHVLLMRINLELLIENLFAPGSFDDILINHPDPWPKKRHKHHRFFHPETMNWLAELLAVGGKIEVASDDTEYFFFILRLFEADSRFESNLPPPFYTSERLPHRPLSRFEKKKRADGIAVRILKFQRISK